MKALILYGSNHGSTKRIVEKLIDYLKFPFDIINVKDFTDYELLKQYNLLLFFAPTYGDEELQQDMEDFLVAFPYSLSNHQVAVCEIGNYEGYDLFSFGASKIMDYHMEKLNAHEIVPSLSMDSLPKKDWNILERWCNLINDNHSISKF